MPKFLTVYRQMVADNHELFKQFHGIHEKYRADKASNQEEYNKIGAQLLLVVQEYEDRLCSGMERGQFGKYSNAVSEKFRAKLREEFPYVELIGAEIL